MRYSTLHTRSYGSPETPRQYISFQPLTAHETTAMLVAMVAPTCTRYLVRAGLLHWRTIVATITIAIATSVILFSIGCASVPSGQSLRDAATNAAPGLVAGIETLRQVTALAGPSIWSELIPAACGLVIGAVGIWARITHGHVATLAAAVREGQQTPQQKEKTAV